MSDPPYIEEIAARVFSSERRHYAALDDTAKEKWRGVAREIVALVPSAPPATTRAEDREALTTILTDAMVAFNRSGIIEAVLAAGFHRSPDAAALRQAERAACDEMIRRLEDGGSSGLLAARRILLADARDRLYPLPSPPKRTVPNVLKLDDGSEWTYDQSVAIEPWICRTATLPTGHLAPYPVNEITNRALTAAEHERAAAVMRHPTVEVDA